MKKGLLLILVASLGLAACNNFEKAPAGTLYKIHKSGGKEKIKVGDFVKFSMVQTTDYDSLMYSSYDSEQPIVFQTQEKLYAGDMYDILTYFGEGDSVTFKVDLDSMAKYTKQPRQPEIKGKYFIFNVKVEKVLSKQANEADSTFAQRASEFFQKDYMAAMEAKKNQEGAKIKTFVEENKLKTTTSASGLQYVIENAGGTEKPAMGDTVYVNYTGRVTKKVKMDIFDTTDIKLANSGRNMQPFQPAAPYGPRPLVIGEIIEGLNEGLMLLGKGAKAKFIIPSSLAYGDQGARPYIAPYTPLVFEIEVTDIKKKVN